MAITPSKDSDAVLLGLGVFGVSALTVSPQVFTDLGYIKGCTVNFTRELIDFESAGVLVKRLAFRDRLSMEVELAEMSIDNLERMIPSTRASETITFGGDRSITRYAVRFEHTRDDDKILQFDMYRTIPAGEVNLAFAEEEFITFPSEWQAEADTTKTAGQQYGAIELVTP
jgi:hypothetical protein